MTLRPLIIDCDTGRDDALSIWSALALGFPLSGLVASYGNTVLPNVYDNTARVLALAGREDMPLFAGLDQPSRPHKGFETIVIPRQKVAGNGLCNLELPRSARSFPGPGTAQSLAAGIEALARDKGKLDYIIMGPATNFAAICRVLGARVHDCVARVIMMGGKTGALWDTMPGADFNLVCDPYSARAILEAGFAVQFVTMNTTWPILLTLEELKQLKSNGTVIADTAKDLMIAHAQHFAPEPVFRFHDPCVALAAADPGRFCPVTLDIVCDDQNPDHARLVEGDAGFLAALYDADDEARGTLLNSILTSLGLAR